MLELHLRCLGLAFHPSPLSNLRSANFSSSRTDVDDDITSPRMHPFVLIIFHFYLTVSHPQTLQKQSDTSDNSRNVVSPGGSLVTSGLCQSRNWSVSQLSSSSSPTLDFPEPPSIESQGLLDAKDYFCAEQNGRREEGSTVVSSTATFIPIQPRDATVRLQARESSPPPPPPPLNNTRAHVPPRRPLGSRLQVQNDAPSW